MIVRLFTYFYIFITLAILFSSNVSFAQEEPTGEVADETADRTDTDKDLDERYEKIEKLKEKIATKVAELRNQDKTAIFGTIKELADSTITLVSRKGERTASYSDDTIFFTLSDGVKKETKADKISKDSIVSVFGYFDQESDTQSAKYVYSQDLPVRLIGKIADIDKSNFTITVASKQKQTIVDYEKYTRAFTLDRENIRWERSGFSKVKLGDMVHIFAKADKSEENRFHADRIYTISFPEKPTPEDETEASPSATIPPS